MYRVVFTKRAQNDAKKLKQAGLQKKAEQLLEVLRNDPFQTPPPYDRLLGELAGA
jgi:Txe/YoeB family toxin of Txe-Axe toxin-antitoxin module